MKTINLLWMYPHYRHDEFVDTLEHSRSPEDILLEREEMTTRLYLIAALPVALSHATPTQTRRFTPYYIAGIKQPEIARREGNS